MMISIPPKYAVSQVIGFIKGKSAIQIARNYFGRQRNFIGQYFWARGYFVSTVGRDKQIIREYIRHQEKEDQRAAELEAVKEHDAMVLVIRAKNATGSDIAEILINANARIQRFV